MSLPYRDLDERITHSQRACAQTCLCKHKLAYVYGIRRMQRAQPLRMGSAVHEGIDRLAKGDRDAIATALAPYDEALADLQGDARYDWQIERETVGCLLQAYLWYYSESELEVVASEQTLMAPIRGTRFKQAGKVDRIVRIAPQLLAVLETKTTSEDISEGSDYWRRLRIDGQISDYMRLARMNGYDVQTVIYDVIRKPTLRPHKIPQLDDDGRKVVIDMAGERVFNTNDKPRQSADTKRGWTLLTRMETPAEYGERLRADIGRRPDYYFQRREVPRLAKDLDEAQYDLEMSARLIDRCHSDRCWPRNTRQCTLMGRCPYFDLCTNQYDPHEDELPDGYEVVADVHQELTE